MKKRGASHVDWAMSLGIFILYILFMLIYIRPSVEPPYDITNLEDMVRENFDNTTKHTIEKVPVFIKTKDNFIPGPYRLFLNRGFPNNTFEGWAENYIAVLNSTNDFVYFDISSCSVIDCNLKIDSYVENNKLYVFWLLFEKDYKFEYQKPLPYTVLGQLVGLFNPQDDNFTVKMGVKEKVAGYYINDLDTFEDKDYDTLKSTWGYPQAKDFTIYVVNTTDNTYSLDKLIMDYRKVKPFQQVNVFVNEFKDWILDKNGNRQGVIVNIRTW